MDNDKVQRVIGIDFGTSTSLIRSKRYQNDQPIGDSYSVSAITYGNGAGDSKAVTLVRHNADDTFTCGRYGEEKLEGSTVYREFKMDLESLDLRKQNLAKELTGEYFKYLYDRYDHQKSDLGQVADDVRTIISYPAKWKKETRDFMEAVAANAGFPNVSSMDEPSAALYAVLCRKKDELSQQGLLNRGQSGYMLLVDMGAGTTDLAVCRYQFSDTDNTMVSVDGIKTEIISTWPDHRSDLTFGGREVDRILEDYLIEYLKSCGFNNQMSERAVRGVSGVKAWKEDTVSLLLTQNQPVNTCSTISQFVMFAPQPQPFPAFDREKFQQMLGSKLDEFKKLVLDCLSVAVNQEPELFAKGIDLVVLTGGHSSWYFTSELLDGTMPGIDHPTLKKVQREKNRVLRLTNPQETVALGMVYSQLPFHIEKKVEAPVIEISDPEIEGEDDKASENISVQNFIKGYRFASITPLYEALVSQLMQNLNVPNQAKVYRAFDATIFGSCKNGTIFTDAGIYCRTMLGTPSFCSWKELAEGLLRFSSGTVYIHNQNSHVEKEAGCFTTMDEDIKTFYRQLKNHAKAEFCWDAASDESVELDYSAVNYEKILSRVLSNFNAGNIALITGKTLPATMRVQFHIPPEETIYLAHDDTRLSWLHVAAAGSVLTGNGVYSKGDNGIVVFVSWQEFAVGTLEPTGNDILLTLLDGTRKIAGRFALCRPQAIALYLDLQKAFREAADSNSTQVTEELTPIEKFMELTGWTEIGEVLSRSHVPPLRKEAEPYVGRAFLAHKSYWTSDGSTTWFWFVIGEKGIYTSNKTMITWKEFIEGDITVQTAFKQYINLTGFPEGLLQVGSPTACYAANVGLPTAEHAPDILIGAFFAQLQKYLRDPSNFTMPSYGWTEEKQQALYDFVQKHPFTGVLVPYTNDPQLRMFLSIPESSRPICQWYPQKPKAMLATALCIDGKGFYSRIYRSKDVKFIPHEAFLNNPLWGTEKDKAGNFYAGQHHLFTADCKPGQAAQTLAFLRSLQQFMRELS